MKFALLGFGPTVRRLALAIGQSSAHRLVHAVHVGNAGAELLVERCPGVRIANNPSALFTEDDLDAVIVSGRDDTVQEFARQMAGQGQSLVVVPEARQDTTFVYELSLSRDEHDLQLVPLPEGACDPVWERVRSRLGEATGPTTVVHWERAVPREVSRDGLIDQTIVNEALLADVVCARQVFGDFDRVTAIRSGESGDRFARQTVTLGGDRAPDVTWSITVADEPWAWRMRTSGTAETIEVTGTAEPPEIRVTGDDVTRTIDSGAVLLQHVVAALEGRGARPSWDDVTRDFEIVDATRRSLKRRRTIDLQFETTSERNQFKSQMAAAGCSVLMLTLFATIGMMLVDTAQLVPQPWIRPVQILLFAPVFVYLLLQLLIVLARPAAGERADEVPAASVSEIEN